MNERLIAKVTAERWLEGIMNPLVEMVPGDPDCDACVLARQYLRALEALEALEELQRRDDRLSA
jgi:hypothetical protein